MESRLTRNEELLLLAVWRLQERAYGLAIQRYLETLCDKDINVAAVYLPLDRLRKKGFLRTWEAEPTAKRGGRRKKFYKLTPEGFAVLHAARQLYERAWAGLPDLAFG